MQKEEVAKIITLFRKMKEFGVMEQRPYKGAVAGWRQERWVGARMSSS